MTNLLKEEYWYRNRQDKVILSQAQKLIFSRYCDNINSTYVVECSRQLGKTYFGCFLADKTARENPNCQVRLATAFQVDIESIIVPNFKNVLSTCPESLKPTFKSAKATYNYPNGSQVVLVGLDKSPDKLRGNRIRLVIIEEAGFVDSDILKYVLDSVVAGAQLREKDARTVLISTPPIEGQDHTFCEIADEMEFCGSYIKITIDDSGLPIDQIKAFENKLGGRDSIAFRREALCERIIDSDRSLIREWDDKYIQDLQRDQYYNYYHKLIGMDLGRVDHTAIIFGYYDFKRAALVIEDELTLNGPDWTTVTLSQQLKMKENSLWGEKPPFNRISDNNNPHLLQDLSSLHNTYFTAVTKDSSLEAMVNRVREFVAQGRIIVNPRCKLLIGSLKYGTWDKNRKQFSRSKTYGHMDHLAALMYLLIHTPTNSNPIPLDHGHTNTTSWLHNIKNQSTKNADTLTKSLIPKRKSTLF